MMAFVTVTMKHIWMINVVWSMEDCIFLKDAKQEFEKDFPSCDFDDATATYINDPNPNR